jgi:hypothetical protein
MDYIVVGRSWHRPALHLPNEDGAPDAWFVVEDKGPEDHDEHTGYWCEFLPWEECKAGDDGAHEFWTLELVEEDICEDCEGDGCAKCDHTGHCLPSQPAVSEGDDAAEGIVPRGADEGIIPGNGGGAE